MEFQTYLRRENAFSRIIYRRELLRTKRRTVLVVFLNSSDFPKNKFPLASPESLMNAFFLPKDIFIYLWRDITPNFLEAEKGISLFTMNNVCPESRETSSVYGSNSSEFPKNTFPLPIPESLRNAFFLPEDIFIYLWRDIAPNFPEAEA
ncbi:hypothetical protein CEXT_378651 [Caerostris extrusa]|uniref:Maturase K n=1 Tax=Caerostris extrusa TaxID=172846 RepID=A0AAV4WM93_CAEEX|nr:hypothetical protein CEXT_378651 [Caerostris extrusa]